MADACITGRILLGTDFECDDTFKLSGSFRALGYLLLLVLISLVLSACAPNIRKENYGFGFFAQEVGGHYLTKSFSENGPQPRVTIDKTTYAPIGVVRASKVEIRFNTAPDAFSDAQMRLLKQVTTREQTILVEYADALSLGKQFAVSVDVYLASPATGVSDRTTRFIDGRKALAFAFSIDASKEIPILSMLATLVHELAHATEPHKNESAFKPLLAGEIFATTSQYCFLLDALPKEAHVTFNVEVKKHGERGAVRRSMDGAEIATRRFLDLLHQGNKYTLQMQDSTQVTVLAAYCKSRVLAPAN